MVKLEGAVGMQGKVSDQLFPIQDDYLKSLKENFFTGNQKLVPPETFKHIANDWFKSSKLNNLGGWEKFPKIDITLGCTHYIESTCLKYGWNIQHLPNEYSYYSINGKKPTEVDDLQENVPLIVSLPTWQSCSIRHDWDKVLHIAEQRNIKIHVDGAWFQSARHIEFDFDHPNIQDFGMSIGKGIDVGWNRIGLRWSRQKSVDSITIMNQFEQIHHTAITCGAYLMENLEKDYAWNKYSEANKKIANEAGLHQTNSCHVLRDNDNRLWGIGKIISRQ